MVILIIYFLACAWGIITQNALAWQSEAIAPLAALYVLLRTSPSIYLVTYKVEPTTGSEDLYHQRNDVQVTEEEIKAIISEGTEQGAIDEARTGDH